MMKLSLMQALEATLTETYQSEIANQIASAWAHDHGSVQYFRASANFIFVFRNNGQPFILRFTHASSRSADAILAELNYLQHLAAEHVPVALPIRSLSDRYVETVSTPLGIFHAVVFERLQGEQYETSELSLEQFTAWGEALGKLHGAAQGYNTASRLSIDDHLVWLAQQLPPHEDAARLTLARLQQQIAQLPRDEQLFGLIHYDFELDNLVWGNAVQAIDFDDCAYYWFVADIAFALRDIFADQPEQVDMTDERFQAFLNGYQAIRSVSQEELLHIPLFLRIHSLVSFVKLLQAADISHEATAPEWAVTLQARLIQKAESYRTGFAAYAA